MADLFLLPPSYFLPPWSLIWSTLTRAWPQPLDVKLGDEASPTLEPAPTIGYPPFNFSQFLQTDLPVAHNSSSDFLHQDPNQNHYLTPIDTTVLTPILYKSILTTFNEALPMFSCTTIFELLTVRILNITYSLGICIELSHATMSQGRQTLPLSGVIPFKFYSLWPGFTCSVNLFLRPFSTYGVWWGDSFKA